MLTDVLCCRVLTKKKGEGRRPGSDAEEGEVSDSESDIGEFDDGLDDELMGDAEDRKRLESSVSSCLLVSRCH